MKRIDAHQHFWKYNPIQHNWISNEMSIIQKDFLPSDLEPLLNNQNIHGSVLVQVDQNPKANEFLLKLAAEHSFIKGVVAWIDLMADDLEKQLEELENKEKIVGFRHIIQGEEKGFMSSKKFLRGLKLISEKSYSYDLLIYHHQLDEAIELIKNLPESRIVIDHIAKPNIKSGLFESWELGMQKLAEFPLVSVKLSGMITEADWERWSVRDISRYAEKTIELFGPERIMFGSDWPVCLLAGSYNNVTSLAESLISKLSQSEQEKIMGLNAISFYGLKST